MKNIGLSIKYFREKVYPGHGGQKEAAEALGVGRASWSKYENSKTLSRPILKRISSVLGVTIEDLLAGSIAESAVDVGEKSPPAAASGEGWAFRERVAMDMKKDFDEFKRLGTVPLIMRTSFDAFECRIIYEIKDLGESKAKLVTSYPITREIADRVMAGEIDPNLDHPDMWRPGKILGLFDYAAIMSVESFAK